MKMKFTFLALIVFQQFLNAQIPAKNIILHTQNDKIKSLLPIDFNNDGWTDYVSLEESNALFFENNGGTAWADRNVVPGFTNAYIINTYAVDMDGDGWTDIVAEKDITYTTVSWYRNPGNLTDPWVNHMIGPSMNMLIGIFDMDSDGDADLVYENSSSYLYWSENESGIMVASHAIPDDYPSVRVAKVFDFDKDGDQDWTAYFYDCCTDYFENNGDGTFSTSTVSTDENQDDIFVGDADGDGYADIVVEDAFNFGVAIFDTISGEFDLDIPWDYSDNILDIQTNDLDDDGDFDWIIFENDPLSEFTNLKWIETNGSSVDLDDMELVIDSLPGNPNYTLLSDYNNDGKIDLLYDDNDAALIQLNEMPDAFFSQPIDPDTSYIRMDLVQAVDIDGDADNDLVVISHDGKMAWFKYDAVADSFFSVHYLPNLEASPYPSLLDHHDLDADGDEDLIASFHSEGGGQQITYYFINDGNGIFTSYEVDANAYNKVWFIDADNDGDEDMIAMQYAAPHNLVLYLRYPDPANYFIYTTEITTGSWRNFEMMDADGDGDDDFIGAGTATSYIVEVPNADGFAFFGTQFNLFNTSCSSPSSLYLNDFDLDGDDDIAYVCSISGNTFLANNSAGVFTPVEYGDFTFASLSEQFNNTATDLNADGYPDIVLSDYSNGTKVKLSTGPGTFQSDYLTYSSDFGTFADLDGDSLFDFAGTNDLEFYFQNDILFINPSFTLLPATLNILQENGASDGITITFNQIPASELIVEITPTGSIDAGGGAGVPVTVSFAADSTALVPKFIGWNIPDDTIIEDYSTATVTILADPDTWGFYAGSINESYSYTTTDNDLGLFYTPAGIATVTEGSVCVFNLHINSIPSVTSTLTFTPQPDISMGAGAGEPLTYTFTSDISSLANKIFYVSTPNDIYYEPVYNSSFLAEFTSDDPVFSSFIPQEKILSVHDNDIVDIVRGGVGNAYYEEGLNTFAISVTISSEPYFNVYIIATPDVQLDLGNGPGIADTITFISDGFINIGQTFSGVPVDDADIEGYHTGLITFSVVSEDMYYDPVTIPNLTVKILDNDDITSATDPEAGQIFSVSPTIGNGIFNFENHALQGETFISVSGLTGQIVYRNTLHDTGTHEIDLHQLSNGTYIFSVQNNDTYYSRRIIVMK